MVKDNLIKEGEFGSLKAIINRAILIDNRNYKQALKQKGVYKP